MYIWLLVGIGGFLGAVARYLLSGWVQGSISAFPAGTLAVNAIGSFAMSLVMFLAEYRGAFSQETRIFLAVGVIGGFTTMSSFSYESFRLLLQREYLFFGLNVLGTLALTLLGVYLGQLAALRLGGIA